MLGILRCHDRFDDSLLVGPAEDDLTPSCATTHASLPLLGLYSNATGDRMLFYRWDGALRLRFGTSPPVPLSGCTAKWEATQSTARFRLLRSDILLLDFTYALSAGFLTAGPDDPTPFAEPEDFDLFLFVANVLETPERAERIFS